MSKSPQTASFAGIFTEKEFRLLDALMIKCGTTEGFLQHRKEGDLPCGDCFAAFERCPDIGAKHRDICGSNQGWLTHRSHHESVCGPCQAARDQHVEDSHGSYAGWMLHRHMGTAICRRCRQAHRTYQNSRPRNRKSRART